MTTICDRILAADKRIGFAMVIDVQGEIIESNMRGSRLMSEEDIEEYTGIWTVIIRGITKQNAQA